MATMSKSKEELMEVRSYPGGEIMLYSHEVVVKINPNASIIDQEDLIFDAQYTAALATKPVPVRIEE